MAFNIVKNTSPPASLDVGCNGSMSSIESYDPRVRVVGHEHGLEGKLIVQRRHVDFLEHQIRWRWLLDSFEGGDRYRNAVYGPDRKGLPCRNLFRHRREYPDPQQFPVIYQGFAGGLAAANGDTQVGYGPYPGMLGADSAVTAQDDDYELRRARTPVPEFVAEAVEIHLGKVYDQEVSREGAPDLTDWWEDVDGRGTPIDDYMRETIAPLLLVLGCLDILLDHPKAPPGEKVTTRADEQRLGLDRCVISYLLPQNMVWWRTDAAGRYVECLVREYQDPSDRIDVDAKGQPINPEDKGQVGEAWRRNYIRYRLWNDTESVLYSYEGDKILERVPHSFGRVPILRLIDLKKHRTPTVGKSRYEAIAELQREYYNRDSELILSDTLQAHPLLSGPEDFCKSDNTLSVGPGYVLPKKKNSESGAYEGWEYVSPPKDPADSLRKNKQDLIDMKDRRACLTKPAGQAAGSGGGGGGSTVAQSGISKQLDSTTGHKVLTSIAKSLSKAERFIAEYAMMVLHNADPSPADMELLSVVYPAKFDLQSAGELTDGLSKIQTTANSAGNLPETEGDGLKAAMRQLLPGQDDDRYAELESEIDELMAKKATDKQMQREAGIQDASNVFGGGDGSATQAGGSDPTGESAGTMVGNMIPSVV